MQRIVHVIFTTHWDREWIQSFEQYRYRLVRLVDKLLDILERETDLVFVCDGQTIMLEDYLELRPENQLRLRSLAQAGRLVFGPWYVLSDQFLEGDEALVRNLLTGCAIAADYGGAMREGYVPDSFGSIATLPAILNGFGITGANMGRGSQAHRIRRDQNLFRWQWKDGSSVLALALGYGNGLELTYPDIWQNISHIMPTPETAARAASTIVAQQGPAFPTRVVYASAGVDHMEMRSGMSALLAQLNTTSEHRFIASTPERFLVAAQAEIADQGIELETVCGEMRGDLASPMSLQGVLSADIRLKQANRAAELLLLRLFEPLVVAARGLAYDHSHILRRAWKLLLAAHPHDPICATCDDNTMDDIHARIRQVRELASIATERLMHELLPEPPAVPEQPLSVVLFNGLPGRGTDAFDLLLRLPTRLDQPVYHLLDSQGCAVGTLRPLAARQMDLETYYALDSDLLRLNCKAPRAERPDNSIYTLCRAQGVCGFGVASGFSLLQLAPYQPAIALCPATDTHIENDLLALDVAPDGRLTLHDKVSGRTFSDLGWFEDQADAGNTYDFLCVAGDSPAYSWDKARVSSRLLRHDDCAAELEVTLTWYLPARLEGWTWPERRAWPPTQVLGQRSTELISHRITTRYLLRPGLGRLEATTVFDNQAIHHRLRLGIGLAERTAIHTGAHFSVLERTWPDLSDPYPTHPFDDFILLGNGLLFTGQGLYEYEARPRDASGGEVLITLCRSVDCVGVAGGCNYEDLQSAKSLGRHEIRYAFAVTDNVAQAAHLAAAYNSPLLGHGCILDSDLASISLPTTLLSVSNQALMVSTCKRAERGDGAIVRLWNMGGSEQRTEVRWDLPYSRLERVELSEEPSLAPVPRELAPGLFEAILRPYEIATFKLYDRVPC